MHDTEALRQEITAQLTQAGDRLYAIMDAARDRGVVDVLDSFELDRMPLYNTTPIPQEVVPVLPYLAPCPPDSALFSHLIDERWGDFWGIFLATSVSIERLHRHLRQHLEVELPGGERVFFRYYDPRVLPSFLSSCDEEQSTAFFGPIRRFLCESPDKGLLVFDPT